MKIGFPLVALFYLNACPACDCQVINDDEALRRAAYVAIVRIEFISIQKYGPEVCDSAGKDCNDENNPDWPYFAANGALVGEYLALETIKGVLPRRGLVVTPSTVSECGIQLTVGKTYLLFLSQHGAAYSCGGSIEISKFHIKDILARLKIKMTEASAPTGNLPPTQCQ